MGVSMKRMMVLLFMVLAGTVSVFASDYVTDSQGRKIWLKDDGTWVYVNVPMPAQTDMESLISEANTAYEKNKLEIALPIYRKIVDEMGSQDGILLYRYFTTYRTLIEQDEKCLELLRAAYDSLNSQYPDHIYAGLAKSTMEAYGLISAASTTTTTTVYTSSSSSYSYTSPKTVYVEGYTRKDGTYVAPYYRSPPTRKK